MSRLEGTYPLLVWAVEPVPLQRRVLLALQSLWPFNGLRGFSITHPDQSVRGWITKDGEWIVTARSTTRRQRDGGGK